jgi:DNA polymerase I-like protein with 3'-5' exonuclease and polymerase domains
MQNLIFHFTEEDKPYLPVLKPLLAGRAQVFLDNSIPVAATEFLLKSQQKGGCAVVSTSQKLLSLVLPFVDRPKIDDYAGSFLEWKGVKFLFFNPLQQLVSMNTGKFIAKRYLDKILAPELWIVEPEFRWELFEPGRLEILASFFDSCSLIAIDIETRVGDPDRVITCISFCGIRLSGGKSVLMNVVVPMTDLYNVLFVRLICSSPVAKTLQNGKYDVAYLLRYGCPITSYTFDTINLFHSWLSELPKDLGFISSFMLRNYSFHKNDGKTGNLHDYYQYNAKDTYTTLLTTIALLLEIPAYATNNFLAEFPLVFPCILSEHTGIKWDSDRAASLKAEVEKDMEEDRRKLAIMTATPNFNPNSPKQVVQLFALLGSKDVTGSTPPEKDKVASRHPLNKKIIERIVSSRENSKLRGSYYKEGIPWNGRCFYALNPHGTDTGRLASRESQFWCGLQIQNIPVDSEDGGSVKEAFVADDGFLFGEADYSQAESRDTAYISGDLALIAAVDDVSKDFHGTNASAFFGVPYEEIVSSRYDEEIEEWIHKTINKALRDLSKRTNHGSTYNMGAGVMLDTMGIEKVLAAKKLLKLPSKWSLLQVTGHLLDVFAQTYKVVKGEYQQHITHAVDTTGLLVGATGWTRRCFGRPKSNKRDLNSYIAHPSQSLNAMTLNKAYLKVFQNIYLPNPKDFKLCAQIHDSILFQYREDRIDLAFRVKEEMRVPILVKDIFGKVRELVVPVDLKGGAKRWSEVSAIRAPKKLLVAAQ